MRYLNINDIASASPDFADWKNADVRQSRTYYDLADQKTAYAFDVLVKGKYAGYILISATTENSPVLELSKGKLPDPDSGSSKASIQKYADNAGYTLKERKPVYLGGTFYYSKYSFSNSRGELQKETYVNELTGQISDLTNTSNQIPVNLTAQQLSLIQQEKREDVQQKWEKQRTLLSRQNASSGSFVTAGVKATSSSNYIYGVPKYAWTIGCSPTASAMVLAYWKNNGYSSLPQGTPLIQALATAMGTGSTWPLEGSTWPWNIAPGINTVFSNYYSKSPASNDFLPDWTKSKNEIDAGRPFVLNMLLGNTPVGGTQAYGQHSVAVAGYVSGIDNYLTIHDTWDTTNYHLISYGNWGSSMNTWVRP